MSNYNKPKLWRARSWGGSVIGDPAIITDNVFRHKNTAQRNAKKLRKNLTAAEKKFEYILNELNGGVLKEKFFTQWAFADKWILDFFFYENRLGIEIDGEVHNYSDQASKDNKKAKACAEWDITLIRITNHEVFGNREYLIKKLRDGWRVANKKIKNSAFAMK